MEKPPVFRPWIARAWHDTRAQWGTEVVFSSAIVAVSFVVVLAVRGWDGVDVLSALLPLVIGVAFLFLSFFWKFCVTPARMAAEATQKNDQLKALVSQFESRRRFLNQQFGGIINNFRLPDFVELRQRQKEFSVAQITQALDDQTHYAAERLRAEGFGRYGEEIEKWRQRQHADEDSPSQDDVFAQAREIRRYLESIRLMGVFDERLDVTQPPEVIVLEEAPGQGGSAS